jgi:glycerol-3-phosphate acyltransferase PlsY
VLGYLLGSCPWGYWLVRLIRHEDIRKVGSGNIGATNVWRTYGRWLGAPVVLLDTLKGFVPALLGVLLVSHFCGIVAGAAAMVGHSRPLFLRFARGGKMVATCGGVFFGLASIIAGLTLPIAAAVYGYPTSVIVFGALAGGAILFLHRGNLKRLRMGTESRFHFRRTASA